MQIWMKVSHELQCTDEKLDNEISFYEYKVAIQTTKICLQKNKESKRKESHKMNSSQSRHWTERVTKPLELEIGWSP